MNNLNIIPSVCCHDCGGACPLNIYVENGKITRIEARDVGYPALKPCVRSLLYHYRVYAPDRLQYPQKRVGERGGGKFKRISWDEALDTIAGNITRIRDTYGPASIFDMTCSGGDGKLHNMGIVTRFLNMAGGHTRRWGGASFQGGFFGSVATYGRLDTGNERADLLNSKMIILWGCNPAEGVFGTETRYYLTQAKEKGIKIVCIDPRLTDSAAWTSEWIPIRPGTDAALAVAMAYVIIKAGLHDQAFLDKYTVGFAEYRDYIFGKEDGIAKTPDWAEQITGISASRISSLALDFARHKPAAIIPGFAPGRTARGEQYHRAAAALAIITGNIGVHGGSTACLDLAMGVMPDTEIANPTNYVDMYAFIMANYPNPVEKGVPQHQWAVKGIRSHTADKISRAKIWDAILKGKSGGYFSDIRMLVVAGGNPLNQGLSIPNGIKALRKLDFVLVHDQFMTATAKFADVLLPSCTWLERNDIRLPWSFGYYALYAARAIEPLYESKSDLEIFTLLAQKMGLKDYNNRTEDDWLRDFAVKQGITDYASFKASGFYKLKTAEPHISFKREIEEPERYKFPTPSGKIELHCRRIEDFNKPDLLPSIPKYIEGWEGYSDPKIRDYPLQLINPHSRRRTHSQFSNIPWYRDIEPHAVWMNPVDAAPRQINNGDRVKVFNDRGIISLVAKVTERIMPGVICVYQGAWFKPDLSGIDQGGCVNVLTREEHSPGGAFTSNSVLAQVEKA